MSTCWTIEYLVGGYNGDEFTYHTLYYPKDAAMIGQDASHARIAFSSGEGTRSMSV